MSTPAGPCIMLVSTTYRGKRPRRPVSRVCLGCYAPVDREHVELHGAETRLIGDLLTEELTEEGERYARELIDAPNPTPYQAALHRLWTRAFNLY